MQNIRDMRGGKNNDAQFGTRMRGQGAIAESLRQMYQISIRKFGLNQKKIELDSSRFRRPGDQLDLLSLLDDK
jgi:hypothetical protein